LANECQEQGAYFEVKKRKEELKRFYRFTVGREMKMIELKKKNLELEQKLRGNKEKGIF